MSTRGSKNKFKLEIELGNESMRTTEDLAMALRKLSREFFDDAERGANPVCGTVSDENGNVVGEWHCRIPPK